jgi:predicted nucleic acid-binding protein
MKEDNKYKVIVKEDNKYKVIVKEDCNEKVIFIGSKDDCEIAHKIIKECYEGAIWAEVLMQKVVEFSTIEELIEQHKHEYLKLVKIGKLQAR